MPKLSVVMSVFNGEKYINKCINSVLKQTFQDFEFIIIEDCSTDNTLKILQEFQLVDSRIIIIKKERNEKAQGFIKNLNLGISKSNGVYIARMDADDICDERRFEKQISFLDSNHDIFMVGSLLNFIDENDNHKNNTMSEHLTHNAIINSMPKAISMFHPSIMFRNTGEVEYREKMWFCEDYDLYFNLIKKNKKFENLPERLLKYRIIDSSLSRNETKIIRWMFVEKARELFRKDNDGSLYKNFNPDNFAQILNPTFHNSRNDLFFGAKVALKYKNKKAFNIIKNKYRNLHGKSSILALIDLIPSKISSQLAKLI